MEYEENGASAFATTLAHRIIFLTRILGGKKYKNSFPHFFFYYTLGTSLFLSLSLSLTIILTLSANRRREFVVLPLLLLEVVFVSFVAVAVENFASVDSVVVDDVGNLLFDSLHHPCDASRRLLQIDHQRAFVARIASLG